MTRSDPRRQASPMRRASRGSGGRATAWIVGLALAAAVVSIGVSNMQAPQPGGHSAGVVPSASLPAGSSYRDPSSAAARAVASGSVAPGESAAPTASPAASASAVAASSGPFPHGLLIADRGNGRILAVTNAGRVFWQFPGPGGLPSGLPFAADDAFVSPDGKTIVANDEYHQIIYRIDIRTRRVVWQYGHFDAPGSAPGYLHNPDDAYPLANGDIVVADIVNCRVIEIAPDKQIVRTMGQAGLCGNAAPAVYNQPNGDTPLPDGGLLITEIVGSRVVRLSPTGRVLFDIHVPVAYPSDAQLDGHGDVIVVDYSSPGAVVAVTPTGRVLWRYAPTSGPGRMDHPSLGTPLPGGLIAVNDDARDRLIVIDPLTRRIVWQYGHTDVSGTAAGFLSDPDGHQPIPANAVF